MLKAMRKLSYEQKDQLRRNIAENSAEKKIMTQTIKEPQNERITLQNERSADLKSKYDYAK